MKFKIINNGKFLYFRSLFGGKPVIGKGLSGTVLKPDIKYNNDNYISKLFILPDSITIEEFERFERLLNTIDYENKYHVPMIDVETIDEKHNLKKLEEEISEQYIYIATYEYGGLSLDYLMIQKRDLLITPLYCKQLLNGFENILEGLVFFSKHGINHNDLHIGNIVVLKDKPMIMRLIDFNCELDKLIKIRGEMPPFHIISKNLINEIRKLFEIMSDCIENVFFDFCERTENDQLMTYFESILSILHKKDSINYKIFFLNDFEQIPIIIQRLKDKINEIDKFLT